MLTTAPEHILWNYTYHCNLNCGHCYSRADHYPDEVEARQAQSIAENIARSGVFKVALGGGEVLFRKDVFQTIETLSASGTYVSVTSNGWPITKSVAKRLQAAGIGDVYISVDSMIPSVHDTIRGRQGTLARATDAIGYCIDAGISTRLSSVITKETRASIDEIVAFANMNNLAEVNFKRFRASGNGFVNRDRFDVSDAESGELYRQIDRLKKSSTTEITLNFGANENWVDGGCSCGITTLTIRPNGDIALCSYSETVLGNLLDDDLSEIWTGSPILKSKRLGVSCEALHGFPSPSKSVWAAKHDANF